MKKYGQEKSYIFDILITTSRNPSHFLRRTSKILDYSLPNSQRMNRGSLNLKQLYNYCWNRKIPRLFILQNSSKGKDIVIIKAYLISEVIQLSDSIIEISELMSLKKHSKNTRIKVEQLKLNFSKSIDSKLKNKVIEIFNPSIHSSSTDRPKYLLSIQFLQKSPNELIGNAIQQSFSSQLHLFTLHISNSGINEQ